jgi:uncharacterized membrane protein YhaH (DUF805 family)
VETDVNMGLIGDFAKGFLIVTVAAWIFAIIEFISIGQMGIALLLFVAFLIPLIMITYERWKDKKVN